MEEFDWSEEADYIVGVLSELEKDFDQETVDYVSHYVNHAEYEMAFEILFTEIMRLKYKPNVDWRMAKEVGLSLNLNKETVYDNYFWDKLLHYIG